MLKLIISLVAGSVSACLLTSCVSSKNASWVNPEFSGRKLGVTLVYASGESMYRVNQFESTLIYELGMKGVAAQSAHQLWPGLAEMDKEEITKLVDEGGFDSLIVTHVLSEADRQQLVATGYTASPNGYGYGGGYWGYGMSYSLNPNFATVSNSTFYELETNVFDVKTSKLVWSGRNEIYDGNSDEKNISKVITQVVRGLSREKML